MTALKKFYNFLKIFKLHWKYVVIIGAPLMLLPLTFSGNKAMQCGYVMGVVSIFWITEAMDLSVASLIPMILFPLFGILTPSKVGACYMKEISLLVFGGIVVAKTFEKQNLHRRFCLNILKLMGPNPIFQYMGFMLCTWFLSMWISNTASTVMMVTLTDGFVEQWSNKSTKKQNENNRNSIDNINSTNVKFEDQVYKLASEKEEVSTDEAQDVQPIIKGLFFAIAYSANCGGIATLCGTPTNIVFYGIMEERYGSKLNLNFATFSLFSLPLSIIILCFIWFIICARYIGLSKMFKRKGDIFRNRKTILMINKELNAMGPISYGEISTLIIFIFLILLWVLREPGIPLLGAIFTYKNSKGESVKYWSDSVSAILAALAVFNFPAKNPFKTKGEVERLMDWKYIQKKFPWNLLFIFGCGYSLALGCEISGLSYIIGNLLINLKNLPHFIVLLIAASGVSFLTEFTSNSATVFLLLPPVLKMAECINIHPIRMGLIVTISSSFAFCFPASNPPNAIIYSTRKIKALDMVSTGLILNFVCVILLTIMTYYYSIPIFHTDLFPDWIKGNCSEMQNRTYSNFTNTFY